MGRQGPTSGPFLGVFLKPQATRDPRESQFPSDQATSCAPMGVLSQVSRRRPQRAPTKSDMEAKGFPKTTESSAKAHEGRRCLHQL